MRPSLFRRAFWIAFAIVSLFGAIPMATVGHAFSRYRSVFSSWMDVRIWFEFFGIFLLLSTVPAVIVALIVVAVIQGFAGDQEAAARRAGVCRSCGYSLRGNASGQCPECGTMCDY